jgi:hypothetical protein
MLTRRDLNAAITRHAPGTIRMSFDFFSLRASENEMAARALWGAGVQIFAIIHPIPYSQSGIFKFFLY